MPSSTKSSPPSALGNVWRRPWMSRSAVLRAVVLISLVLIGNASAEPEFAFGVQIQRTPEHAIDDDDVEAHHGDSQHDAVEIAGIGLLRNIGAEPFGFEVLVAP